MFTSIGTAAPALEADAYVRGEGRRRIELAHYRGGWIVLAFGVRRHDVLELSALEEAFAADGAVVLAASVDDFHEVASRYAAERVRFPILADVPEFRRLTAIVDPGGVVRHLGLHRTARETLASLEALMLPLARAA
jgi:alkyl hydroperoxide reductase subunit AhpC